EAPALTEKEPASIRSRILPANKKGRESASLPPRSPPQQSSPHPLNLFLFLKPFQCILHRFGLVRNRRRHVLSIHLFSMPARNSQSFRHQPKPLSRPDYRRGILRKIQYPVVRFGPHL